jgi:hypothetical protein
MPFHVMARARKDSRIPAKHIPSFPQRLDPLHHDPLVGHTSYARHGSKHSNRPILVIDSQPFFVGTLCSQRWLCLGRFLLEVHGQCFFISAYKLFDVFDFCMSKAVCCFFDMKPVDRQQDLRATGVVKAAVHAVVFIHYLVGRMIFDMDCTRCTLGS